MLPSQISVKSPPRCHDCGSEDLQIAAGYERLARVASDCTPWQPGGTLALCRICALVQTVVNEQWQRESDQIYSAYSIYHQSGGIEQPVFDKASGVAQARSAAILENLTAKTTLPATGRWLDIGCGNGALLRACSRKLPDWTLFGSEVNSKYQELVESIPGVERLFTVPLEDIPGMFDAISLVHVLEHIPRPGEFLRSVAKKLKPGGLLLLQVPDCQRNFFMLVVADHCSHFSVNMLARVAATAGFQVMHATSKWVPKEISLVARSVPGLLGAESTTHIMMESEEVMRGFHVLEQIMIQAEPLSRAPSFGIFGTAIAATWLDAQTGQKAEFFVDEDPDRIGKRHLGRPILAPAAIPQEATIYVALPSPIADTVVQRLRAACPSARLFCPRV